MKLNYKNVLIGVICFDSYVRNFLLIFYWAKAV